MCHFIHFTLRGVGGIFLFFFFFFQWFYRVFGLVTQIDYWPALRQCQSALPSIWYVWYYVHRECYMQRQQAFCCLIWKKCDWNSQLWSSCFIAAFLKMTTQDAHRKQVSCSDNTTNCHDGWPGYKVPWGAWEDRPVRSGLLTCARDEFVLHMCNYWSTQTHH